MVANVAYCADLSPSDMTTVLMSLFKPGCQIIKSSTLLSLTGRRFLMCPSPFSRDFERNVLKDKVHNCNSSDVTKVYKEQRKATLLRIDRKSLLLKDRELAALAESKVRRNILSKRTTLRRLDSESAVKLLTKAEPDVTTDKIRKRNKNQPKGDVHLFRRGQDGNVRGVPARCVRFEKPHDALLYYASPADETTQNKPLSYRAERENSKEKYPVQVTTDAETDCLSYQLAIGTPSQKRSRFQRSYGLFRSHGTEANGLGSSQSANVLRHTTVPPRHWEYVTSDKRLASFNTSQWSVDEKPEIRTLVDQGFFYTGTQDLVRCFQCGIGLKDWVKDDNPVKEHVKYSANCAFLKERVSGLQLEQIKHEIAAEGSVSRDSQSFGTLLPYRVRSPKYQTMEARIASFRTYPKSPGIRIQLLAVSGLYYTGDGDLCRCFTCDGGLKDWSAEDDPCKEHAKYFPKCEYINQLKGKEYVEALQRERQNSAAEGAAGGNSFDIYTPTLGMKKLTLSSNTSSGEAELTLSQFVQSMGYSEQDVISAKTELQKRGDFNPTGEKVINILIDMKEKSSNAAPVTQASPEDDLDAFAKENERLRVVLQCMLCITEEPDVLFLPCAHHRVCHNCAKKITHCPKCNSYITEKVRTYMA